MHFGIEICGLPEIVGCSEPRNLGGQQTFWQSTVVFDKVSLMVEPSKVLFFSCAVSSAVPLLPVASKHASEHAHVAKLRSDFSNPRCSFRKPCNLGYSVLETASAFLHA